jgi:hypothetical protein
VNHQRAVCWGADNLTVEVTPHTAESIFGRTRLESALFFCAAGELLQGKELDVLGMIFDS